MSAIAALYVVPEDLEREAFVDQFIADIAGMLPVVREPHMGSAKISDEQIWERSRAIAHLLLLSYEIKPLGGAR